MSCILISFPLLTLRARRIAHFADWISGLLKQNQKDTPAQAHVRLQSSSSAPRGDHGKSSLYGMFRSHTTTSPSVLVPIHLSWFQQPGQLEASFTSQPLFRQHWNQERLFWTWPAPRFLNSAHRVLKEVQLLHIFALNNFAAASAGKDSTWLEYLSNHHALRCPEKIPLPCHIPSAVLSRVFLPEEIFVPPT